MGLLCAQGDILIERVGDVEISGHVIERVTHGSAVVAGGEKAGHFHTVIGSVTLFRHWRVISPPGSTPCTSKFTALVPVCSTMNTHRSRSHGGPTVSDASGNWNRRIPGSTSSMVCWRIDAHAGHLG